MVQCDASSKMAGGDALTLRSIGTCKKTQSPHLYELPGHHYKAQGGTGVVQHSLGPCQPLRCSTNADCSADHLNAATCSCLWVHPSQLCSFHPPFTPSLPRSPLSPLSPLLPLGPEVRETHNIPLTCQHRCIDSCAQPSQGVEVTGCGTATLRSNMSHALPQHGMHMHIRPCS